MSNGWRNKENSDRLYLGGAAELLQMVAAAMKLRHLLLGRKAMTNLKSESESTSVLSNSYSPWNSLGQNTGLGSLSILQGIFPT